MNKSKMKSKLIDSEVVAFSHYGDHISIAIVDMIDGEEYVLKISKGDIMKIHDVIFESYMND